MLRYSIVPQGAGNSSASFHRSDCMHRSAPHCSRLDSFSAVCIWHYQLFSDAFTIASQHRTHYNYCCCHCYRYCCRIRQVFTIFIGDDKTDEDAFQVFSGSNDVAAKKGRQPGLGILVSEESRQTHAAFTLKNPHEVAELLSRLVNVGKSMQLEPVHVCTSAPGSAGSVTPKQQLKKVNRATAATAAAADATAAANAAASTRQQQAAAAV
jgi:Trehalose-phosphatase